MAVEAGAHIPEEEPALTRAKAETRTNEDMTQVISSRKNPALTREKAGIQVKANITQVIFTPGINGTVAADHELEIVRL